MGHSDIFKYSMQGMRSRKLRSYLTILGVVIGIASIVAIVSIGQGISSYIQDQLNTLGTDYVTVVPGKDMGLSSSSMNPTAITKAILTEKDIQAIESVGGVKKAYGQIMMQPTVEFNGQQGGAILLGLTSGIFDDFPMYKLQEGRFFRESSNEVIIGASLANDTFKKEIHVGDTIKLNNVSFRVVGVLEKGVGMMSVADSMIGIDLEDAIRISGRSRANIAFEEIDAKLLPDADPETVGLAIEQRLLSLHKETVETEDFTVYTPATTSNLVGGILATLNLFLGGLAGIALVVGGVGIANTMFMAVTERTREIGVLKALGARNNDILEIFIIESGLIGLMGGAIGCAIGFSLSVVMNLFGVPSNVDITLVSWAILFSFIIGVVSGFFPAALAARLEPVEALRYE